VLQVLAAAFVITALAMLGATFFTVEQRTQGARERRTQ
jgi:hypothetical protein